MEMSKLFFKRLELATARFECSLPSKADFSKPLYTVW
jgi:hypothetical protein